MNPNTAHPNSPSADPAYPTPQITDPSDIWQHYPTHPALVAPSFANGSPSLPQRPRRALTTAWVASTVALVIYPLSIVLGGLAFGFAMGASEWAIPLALAALVGFAVFVILTFTALAAAIAASRPSVRRGGELVGIWVLVALDVAGLLYLLTFVAPAFM